MIAFYAFILSLALTMVLVPYLTGWSGKLGLMDEPGERKIHLHPIPRVGGIAIAAGTLISSSIWVAFTDPVTGYLTGASIIAVFGVADDVFDLDYRLKFLGQIAAALVFVYISDIWLTRPVFVFYGLMPVWLGLPLTIFWIVGVTNAINLSDGMDGLAGGSSLLVSVALGFMAFSCGDKLMTLLALALIASVVGFLRYNTFPARVFMGDTGSQFLGFSVAVFSLILIEHSSRAMSPLVPLLIIGLPITDTLIVFYHRVRAGGSPFYPDRRHLHHRMLDLGLTQYEAVLAIYILQVLLIAAAWSLRYEADIVLLGFYLAFFLVLYWSVGFWSSHETHARRILGKINFSGRVLDILKETNLLKRLGQGIVLYGLVLLFSLISLTAPDVDPDIGWLALIVGGIVGLGFFVRSISLITVVRIGAFVLSVVAVYLMRSVALWSEEIWYFYFCLMALGIALWLRFGGGDFQVNTLDILIVLIVVTVPNMPLLKDASLGPMFIQALLLFYACELLLSQNVAQRIFRTTILFSLAVIAIRGISLPF